MSKEKNLLEFVVDKFSNIKKVLRGKKDIEKFLDELKLDKEQGVGTIMEKAKSLVDSLYEQSVQIKTDFYNKYGECENLHKDKDIENCEGPIPDTSKNSEISTPAENDTDHQLHENNIEEHNEQGEEVIDKNTDNEDRNQLNNVEEDPLNTMDSSDIIDSDSSIIENDKEDTNKESPIKSECEGKQSLIRLVDLNKLIDPKQKNLVALDSSVIILSSDEETKTPTKEKNTKKKCDSSDLKPPKKSTKKQESDVSVSKKNQKKKKNDTSLTSDSSVEEISLLDKFKKKKHRNETSTNPSSKKSHNEDVNEIVQDSESENENLSDNDQKHFRKSSRLQANVESKKSKRERLRNIFQRKLTRSSKSTSKKNKKLSDDSSNDSESNTSEKRKVSEKHSKEKKELIEEQLSDTSSLSSTNNDIDNKDKDRIKANKKTRRLNSGTPIVGNVDADDKFKYEVYIPLPRFESSQLKEIYLKNKDIFEIRSLRKIDVQRNKKRNRQSKKEKDKSSSENEKPKSKKSRNGAEKKHLSDDTSDDESLKKSSNSNSDADDNKSLKENVGNKDDHMADIAMEGLKELNDGKLSEASSNESELDKKNQEKEKHCEMEDESDKENDTPSNDDKSGENIEKDNSDKEAASDTELNKEKKDDEKESDHEKKKESSSDSEIDEKQRKKWQKDKLLTDSIDGTDSQEELKKNSRKKKESGSESDPEDKSPILKKSKVKKRRKVLESSDSEGSNKDKKEDSNASKGSSSSDESEEIVEKPSRKRIKRTKDSSSSSDDDKSTRKHIRRLIDKDSLSETTKQAEAEEKERKARIAEKQKKYNKMFEATAESKVDKVVLDYDEKKKEVLIAVKKKIVKKLKPHQASGIQFMWDACFESVERAKKTKGSGCILAHCMGLGKTLQVIALSHTLLTNSDITGVQKIMVVCPINTVLNWKSEFSKWLPNEEDFEVFELVSCKQNYERQYIVQEWSSSGGVLIIGYTMFRNLSNPDNKRLSKKMRLTFSEGLVDPGPDLVVCDEGHLLKNEKTHLSIAMNRIKTARRIVLTGTPLQNNLKEYWCMVQFIKPNLLGTYREYLNRFVNPIINGQYTDSTQHDILLMRKRSHVLHKLLDGVVQRRDYAVLEPYLPAKHEYVLFIKLSEVQVKLYQHYMTHMARKNEGSNRTSFLFADFQELQRICTHPRVLLDKSRERREKESEAEDSEGSLRDFIDDDHSSAATSSSSSEASNSDSEDSDGKKKSKPKGKQQKVRVTRAQAAQRKENNEESEPELELETRKEWFQQFCDGDELDNINNSGKILLLFQILKECEEIGDKVLIFSQSLYTLNCIEYFLDKIDEATQKGNSEKIGGLTGSWSIGLDYFRLDGSSSCDNRASWCNMFNNPINTRARLFLISTKAGGLGINLVAANRVIIFDVSWNPSHDIQSIYRVYRFGQTKPCYIYRFVSYGTMEMKIYERQVTKQAISKRVIDEQQIDRHYNQNDLQELYQVDLEPTDRPIPLVPKDVLLGEMLQKYENTIFKYHLHQSLLENKEEEGLNEEERKAAWEEFENEKVLRKNTGFEISPNVRLNAQAIETALASIVRKDNPTWSEVQIKGIIPALVQQLQAQLSEGDTTMAARVQQEIQLLQEIQAQKYREAIYQQQLMRMIQRQQQANMLGNMYVDPAQIGRLPMGPMNNVMIPGNMNRGGPSTAPRSLPNDIIELND